MTLLLRVTDVHVDGPGQPRLGGIDLRLERGERLGLVGLNGAGKSTLLHILAGAMAPDRGQVELLGKSLIGSNIELRRDIGYLPQRVPAYPELRVRENLLLAGRLRGLTGKALADAVATRLADLQLGSVAERLAGRLSDGMLQRLGLAQAVIHDPALLLLDEPTAGLDPLQTAQVRELLATLSAHHSLIIATHLLDDVYQLCSRAVIMRGGAIGSDHEVSPGMDLMAHLDPATAP